MKRPSHADFLSATLAAHEQSFALYRDELLAWGKTHNITNYKSAESIMQNIADSLRPLGFIADFERALDIGSGCGFPAIALAICAKNRHFTLLEPNAKRASFLSVVAANLGLKNVAILRVRLEHFTPAQKFDLITSRAVTKAHTLIKSSAHLLKSNGHFLLYKSANEFRGAESALESVLESAKGANFVESSADSSVESAQSRVFYFYQSKLEAEKWAESLNF